MVAATVLRPPPARANLQRVDFVRVTGLLEHDAELRFTAGHEPRALLKLEIVPPRGLRYHVLQDLGTDPTDHMHAEARLTALRRGALVSATGRWLRPQRDHGHEVLVLMECTGVITHATAAEAEYSDHLATTAPPQEIAP